MGDQEDVDEEERYRESLREQYIHDVNADLHYPTPLPWSLEKISRELAVEHDALKLKQFGDLPPSEGT